MAFQLTAPMAFQTAGARHITSLQGNPRNLAEHLWKPCGPTLMEPTSWNPGATLVNLDGTLPQTTQTTPQRLWNPGGTLVQPSEPGGTLLVERWWNPPTTSPQTTPLELSWDLTSNHPGPPCSPCRTLVEPWQNPGTLVEPYLRPAPDHPGAYLG